MINIFEVNETNKMIEQENLDVRTITMGISLLDCIDSDLETLNKKIYDKITTCARDLVSTGEAISSEYGIPIVNKRISVTPIALVGGAACKTKEDFSAVLSAVSAAYIPCDPRIIMPARPRIIPHFFLIPFSNFPNVYPILIIYYPVTIQSFLILQGY